MPSQTIAGSLVGGALGAFGKKPVIPDLPTLDVGKEQQLSISDNLAALPSLEALANQTNRFNFDQVNQMLDKALPGFRSGLQSATTNAASLARGEVPQDVLDKWQQQNAASSLSGGYGGSGLALNADATKRLLGTMQMTGEGQNRLMQLGSFGRSLYPQFDFTQAFISPAQRLNFDWQQNLAQFQVNLMKAQVAAAPDPAMADLAGAFDNFFKTWESVGMGMLGGGMGGMGGQQPQQQQPQQQQQQQQQPQYQQQQGGGGPTSNGGSDADWLDWWNST